MNLGAANIITADALEGLRTLPDGIADMCVTSPPYFGLRDYGTATLIGGDPDCDHRGRPLRTRATINQNYGTGMDVKNAECFGFFKKECGKCGAIREDKQIGLESTPDEYVERLVAVFRELRRMLRDDGTLWLNIGDTYAGYHGNKNAAYDAAPSNKPGYFENQRASTVSNGIKAKSLWAFPWLLAFALRADGCLRRIKMTVRLPLAPLLDSCSSPTLLTFATLSGRTRWISRRLFRCLRAHLPFSKPSLLRSKYGVT